MIGSCCVQEKLTVVSHDTIGSTVSQLDRHLERQGTQSPSAAGSVGPHTRVVSIGPHSSQRAVFGRAAAFVDKVLRGSKPADLPVEQLTTVEFAFNATTAQSLGLSIPSQVAAQVTEWVQ